MRALTRVLLITFLLLVSPFAAGAKDLETIDINEAYDPEENILRGPVFEGAAVAPLHFETLTSSVDHGVDFIRRIKGGFVRAPRYGLARSVDLGAILTSVMRSEAVTMGLRSAPQNEAAVVRGEIQDAFLETRGVFGGALLFFGYLEVDLTVTLPGGDETRIGGTFHGMYVRYNGGFGARDEAGEATARFLIDAGQEIVSRIARQALAAPVHPGVQQALTSLVATGVEDHHTALRRVGLSGLSEAVPTLLELVDRETEEDERGHTIDALANFAHPDALAHLAKRYRAEKDEDCRFYTLKAFAYAPSAETRQWIADLGRKDQDKAVKRFAEYLLKKNGS